MNEKYLEKIRQTVLDFMKDEPAKIYLFGSWARGEQRKNSDVDIAIEYTAQSNRKKILAVREILEESSIPYRVDVVDLNFSSPALIEEIRKDGLIWKN